MSSKRRRGRSTNKQAQIQPDVEKRIITHSDSIERIVDELLAHDKSNNEGQIAASSSTSRLHYETSCSPASSLLGKFLIIKEGWEFLVVLNFQRVLVWFLPHPILPSYKDHPFTQKYELLKNKEMKSNLLFF